MTLEACAAFVERGDPDRFLAAMAAPLPAREVLLPIYAYNLEIARAPWVTKEPMIAEMRLQWWRDVIAEPIPRAHEVAGPLHRVIAEFGVPVAVLDQMAAARRWDIYPDAFEGPEAFSAYIEDSSAGLFWATARALGAPDSAEGAVRNYGWAAGLAAFLRAVPGLEERGRLPLVDGRTVAVKALAEQGLDRLSQARSARRSLPKGAASALLPGWQTEGLLRQVVADPGLVAKGQMGLSEFARRGGLIWQAFTGRW